jgi:hypothetical protein
MQTHCIGLEKTKCGQYPASCSLQIHLTTFMQKEKGKTCAIRPAQNYQIPIKCFLAFSYHLCTSESNTNLAYPHDLMSANVVALIY